MKLSTALLLFAGIAVHAAVLERAGCNANNCARAVTGTRDKEPGITSRQADCSSFMLTTVTPNPTTITLTNTATVTATIDLTVTTTGVTTIYQKRAITVSPSAVPTYASACSSPAAYSSACSCWGITASVTTVPTSTVYVTASATVTETATRTVTVVATETAVVNQCTGRGPGGCAFNRPVCAEDENSRCFCGTTIEGGYACYTYPLEYPCQPACSSSAACGSGLACMPAGNTCCSGSQCIKLAPGKCPAPLAAVKRKLLGLGAPEPRMVSSREETAGGYLSQDGWVS